MIILPRQARDKHGEGTQKDPCSVQLSRAINDPSETRPIIMCEYAHAMGNSNGSLDEYLLRETH